MLISLDDQIRKDKENQYHRRTDRREGYRNRKTQNYPQYYQDRHKRNYSQRGHLQNRQKNYEERHSPQQRQRSFIKISNLHYSVDKERLETICSSFGKLKTCRIDWDKMGRSNQTATIEYFNRQDQQKAMKQLSGMNIQGQLIKIETVNHYSPLASKKHHQIAKNYGKFQNSKYYRRG